MLRFMKFLLRFSRPLLVLVVITVIAAGWQASLVEFDFTLEVLFQSNAREVEQFREFEAMFGSDDHVVFLAFRTNDVFHPQTMQELGELSRALRAVPGVTRVFSVRDVYALAIPAGIPAIGFPGALSPEQVRRRILESPIFSNVLVDPGGRVAAMIIEVDPDLQRDDERAPVLAGIREAVADAEEQMGTVFHMAGIPVIEQEYVRLIRRDLITFMPIALAVFFFLLALYFRNILGVFLPLLSVMVGVVWTVGLMHIFGFRIGVLTSIVPNLILVIGMSDAIHLLSHYQENLQEFSSKRDALARTILVMVGVCFLTTFTSSVGFASLLATDLPIVREFGLITGVGLMLAYVAVMTVCSGALEISPPMRVRVADQVTRKWSDRFLGEIARINLRSRWVIGFGLLAFGAFSVAGILRIESRSSWLQEIRADSPVTQAHEFIDRNLSGVFTIEFLVRGDLRDPQVVAAIDRLEARIREEPRVVVVGPVEFVREARRWTGQEPRLPESREEIDELLRRVMAHPEGEHWLRRIVNEDFTATRITVRRSDLDSVELEALVTRVMEHYETEREHFELIPTGKSWMAKRALDGVVADMNSSGGLAGLVIFAMMGLMFRSWKIGLLSMIPNISPLLVTAGLMGWLGVPLNFSTVTIFSISLGLAVDNTIHYLSRYRIEFAKDGDHEAAMVRALKSAGRPMIFASVLLMLGFGAILTSNFRFTFHFGLLGGATVLTALAADLFLTPTLMVVFKPRVGRWEGLESRLSKLDQRLGALVHTGETTIQRNPPGGQVPSEDARPADPVDPP